MNPKQVEAVLRLPGPRRFEHFMKVAADREQVWGLFGDGWAMASADDGKRVFPLWPAAEYAELCATDEWANCKPKSISLDELSSQLLPRLEMDGALPGVFYTPGDKGVTPTIDEFRRALESELARF